VKTPQICASTLVWSGGVGLSAARRGYRSPAAQEWDMRNSLEYLKQQMEASSADAARRVRLRQATTCV
jgi:hypothetical protein